MTNKQIVDIKLTIERHTKTTTKRVNSCALVRGKSLLHYWRPSFYC